MLDLPPLKVKWNYFNIKIQVLIEFELWGRASHPVCSSHSHGVIADQGPIYSRANGLFNGHIPDLFEGQRPGPIPAYGTAIGFWTTNDHPKG